MWGVYKSCFWEMSVSTSVWVNTIKTSVFNFSACRSLQSLERFSGLFWVIMCNNRVVKRELKSAWSLSWSKKFLRRFTWKRWKFIALKKFLLHSSRISLVAWRVVEKTTRSAGTWNCLQDFWDFLGWLEQQVEDLKKTVTWIVYQKRVYEHRSVSYENNFG